MIELKMSAPSVPPTTCSQHLSGCGIMPRTLPLALTMPAMLSTEPFGLESGVTRPSVVEYRKTTLPSSSSFTQGIGFGEVPALAVRDGDLQHLTDRISAAEWGFGSLGTKIHPHTAKLKDVVSHQRARQ